MTWLFPTCFLITLCAALFIPTPLMLMILTLLTAMLSGMIAWLTTSKWLSYAVFLIFLGGMMIVFLYTSILSSNDKIMLPKPSFLLMFFFLWLFLPLNFSNLHIPALYTLMNLNLTSLLIFLLLMILLLIVKLTEPSKGTMIKKF